MRLIRLWHTVRWLRPVQIWGRLWFRLYRPRPDLRPAPALRVASGRWVSCAWRQPSMTGPNEFVFLNAVGEAASASAWNNPHQDKLWLYNLHYFDDLNAAEATKRADWHRSLIARWVAENPPADGNGWEPYCLSLRIVNWVKWALAGNSLEDRAQHSLAVQTRYLRRRLEIHLLGNHLWANAKALVFAGTFVEGREADRWRAKGLALLGRELDEQVLADGGHFERSPMYHAIILEDLLELIQLAALFPGVLPDGDLQRWRSVVPRMLHWLRVMTHPDGGIAFFNDATMGIAPAYADLAAYARSLRLTVPGNDLGAIESLSESGYVRLEAGPAVLIADVGEIGPDYLPGHAHADTLSFELSLHGRRVLVNEGISTYEAGEDRLRQRGTAAHNTVEVNGENSSEVWSSFRVARRARPRNVAWVEKNGELRVRAAHDGYTRLGDIGETARVWTLTPHRLCIEDQAEGKPANVIARFRGHPSFAVEKRDGCSGTLRGGNISLSWLVRGATNADVATDVWHPRFGAGDACQTLELEMRCNRLSTEFFWE